MFIKLQGVGFRVYEAFGCRTLGFGLRVKGLGFRV